MAEGSIQWQMLKQSQTRREFEPRFNVWEHFTRFKDDHGNVKARCNSCGVVLSSDSKSSGIGSLWMHRKRHEREGTSRELNPRPPQPLSSSCVEFSDQEPPRLEEEADHRTRPDEETGHRTRLEEETGCEPCLEKQANADLARMIALHGYDPSVLEDDYFRSFVHHLNPEFRVPSRSAIEKICDNIFDKARTDMFSMIKHTSGRISLALGRTEVKDTGEFLFTACHFIDDEWNLRKLVMDAYVDVHWIGFYGPLSGFPEVCLDSEFFYIESIDHVIDVISARDTLSKLFMMAREKQDTIIHFHLKNYMEEKLPKTYSSKREVVCAAYMDCVLHSVAKRLILRPDSALEKCLESGIKDLHLTRQRRQQLLSDHGLDHVWAYGDHWYACYCSLEVLRTEGSSAIADANSEFVLMLCSIWGEIYRAIKRISASSGPTSHLCLPALLSVREVLQSELERASGKVADDRSEQCLSFLDGKDVADVLRDALDTLDKSLKESYLVWSIPLVLDPRYKLTYIEFSFGRAFGSEASHYISEVRKQIKKLYADYTEYGGGINIVTDSNRVVTTRAVDSVGMLGQAWAEHCRLRDGRSYVTEVDSNQLDPEKELDRYLGDRLVHETEGFDILDWWKINNRSYPTVARMARDALAMPTYSKLSSEQMGHVRSIIHGYSKEEYIHSVPKCE